MKIKQLPIQNDSNRKTIAIKYFIYEECEFFNLPKNKIGQKHKRARLPQIYEIRDTLKILQKVPELQPKIFRLPEFEINTVDASLAILKETGKRAISGSISFGFLANPGAIDFSFVERNQYLENFEEMLKLSFFNYQQLRLGGKAESKDLKNKHSIDFLSSLIYYLV